MLKYSLTYRLNRLALLSLCLGLALPTMASEWFKAGYPEVSVGGAWKVAEYVDFKDNSATLTNTNAKLDFAATTPKVITENLLTITNRIRFTALRYKDLPSPTTMKAGLVLANREGVVNYYGVALDKVSNVNGWLVFTNATAISEEAVTVKVSLKSTGYGYVKYEVDGKPLYAQDSQWQSDKDLAWVGINLDSNERKVSGVAYAGIGTVSALQGEYEGFEAVIGEKYYSTLADAVTDSKNNDQVWLVMDATTSGLILPDKPEVRQLALDLNTHTLSGDTLIVTNGSVVLRNGTMSSDVKFDIAESNTVRRLRFEGLKLTASQLQLAVDAPIEKFDISKDSDSEVPVSEAYEWNSNGQLVRVAKLVLTESGYKLQTLSTEEQEKSHPENAVQILSVVIKDGKATVTAKTEQGLTYKLMRCTSLGEGFKRASANVTATAASLEFLDNTKVGKCAFYRVEIVK